MSGMCSVFTILRYTFHNYELYCSNCFSSPWDIWLFLPFQLFSSYSHRVLKPPGGGSSNIFGTEPAGTAKPRANPPGAGKPQDAGIFGQSASDSSVKNHQRSARDGDDSFNRLFGDNASSPALSQKGTGASQRVNTHDNLFGDSRSSHKPSTPTEPSNTHEHIFGDPTAAQGEGATTGRYSGKGRGMQLPFHIHTWLIRSATKSHSFQLFCFTFHD